MLKPVNTYVGKVNTGGMVQSTKMATQINVPNVNQSNAGLRQTGSYAGKLRVQVQTPTQQQPKGGMPKDTTYPDKGRIYRIMPMPWNYTPTISKKSLAP
jgi:hypothetical protein